MRFENTLEYARQLDETDPLAHFREEFYIPVLNGKEVIYLSGNSMGLQSKGVQDAVLDHLEDWASFGSEGNNSGNNPWKQYHKKFPELLAPLAGALPEEIVVMNQLTVNLHLMLSTFYRPEGKRTKILIESNAFASSVYAVYSQLRVHGLNPDDHIIKIKPREGDWILRDEDIIKTIKDTGESLALVLLGGVNYYTGQVLFMKSITKAAHEAGAFCGFDLAHGVGNISLKLHEWEVDFAVWCSYKYLNSGPGGVAGVFIHKAHAENTQLIRLMGRWCVEENKRSQTRNIFDPLPSAEGWQLSMPSIVSLAIHYASLEIFQEAGFENILKKSEQLSAFLIFILNEILDQSHEKPFDIITPLSPGQRGCQLSLRMGIKGKHQFDVLKNNGVIASWKEPGIIRVAPVPLYNKFEDIFYFGKILEHAIHLG